MSRRLRKILFYDRHTSGHHMEYLRYLVDYCRENNLHHVHMALPQDAVHFFQRNDEHPPVFISLPTASVGIQLKQTIVERDWLVETIEEHQFTDLFFLNFDPYQYVVNTRPFRQLPCKVHGILFSPPHRILPANYSSVKQKTKQLFRRIRKQLQLKWAVRNPNLKTLFILDDEEGVELLNSSKGTIFKLLNDPIERKGLVTSASPVDQQLPGSKLLLAFGSIIQRKNLENIILSLEHCTEKLTLLIAGKGSLNYVKDLKEIAKKYDGSVLHKVIFENRFVSDNEREELFFSADAIIMVYCNFYGSSGVLGHAAKYGKPVIVSNEGLIAALTHKYNMGVAVGATPLEISQGISELFSAEKRIRYKGQDYLLPKTTENLCHIIFSSMEVKDIYI